MTRTAYEELEARALRIYKEHGLSTLFGGVQEPKVRAEGLYVGGRWEVEIMLSSGGYYVKYRMCVRAMDRIEDEHIYYGLRRAMTTNLSEAAIEALRSGNARGTQ